MDEEDLLYGDGTGGDEDTSRQDEISQDAAEADLATEDDDAPPVDEVCSIIIL